MFLNILLSVCGTVAFFQLSAAYNVAANQASKSAIDTAKKLLDELADVTGENAKKASDGIDYIRSDLSAFQLNILGEANGRIQDTFTEFRENLTKIEKEAQDEGKDTAACTNGIENKFNVITKSSKDKVVECGRNETQEAKIIFDTAMNNIQASYKTVENLTRDVNQCKSDEKCLDDLIEQIKIAIEESSAKIGSNVVYVLKRTTILRMSFQKSAINSADQLSVDAENLLNEVIKCFGEK